MSNVFKGEFKVTTTGLMGKADVKKLRASLMTEFPALSKRNLVSCRYLIGFRVNLTEHMRERVGRQQTHSSCARVAVFVAQLD